jgi:hypothetical protein
VQRGLAVKVVEYPTETGKKCAWVWEDIGTRVDTVCLAICIQYSTCSHADVLFVPDLVDVAYNIQTLVPIHYWLVCKHKLLPIPRGLSNNVGDSDHAVICPADFQAEGLSVARDFDKA